MRGKTCCALSLCFLVSEPFFLEKKVKKGKQATKVQQPRKCPEHHMLLHEETVCRNSSDVFSKLYVGVFWGNGVADEDLYGVWKRLRNLLHPAPQEPSPSSPPPQFGDRETGLIRFRRARFQTLNSPSFGENSVSSSQPIICVPK